MIRSPSLATFGAIAALLTFLAVTPLADAAGSPIVAGPPVTFPDPVGDSGTAPDVSGVVVSNDANGRLDFRIDFPSQPELAADSVLFLVLDTDNNPLTGAPQTYGGDYYFALYGADRSYAFFRWDGTTWTDAPSDTVEVSYSSGARISVNRNELGTPDEVTFYAKALQLGTGPEDGRVDFAPDVGTSTYVFPLPIPPAPVPSPTVTVKRVVTLAGGAARAGKTFQIKVSVLVDVEGKADSVRPAHLACSVKAASVSLRTKVALAGPRARTCTLVIPQTAAGKKLVVTLSGMVVARTAQGLSEARFKKVVTFAIRR